MKMLGGGNSGCDDSDACEDENRNKKSGGRKENEDFKCDALLISPIIEDVTNSLALPCNDNCPLGKICASKISMQTVFEQRLDSCFNPAPTEIGNNAEKLLKFLLEKSDKDSNSNYNLNFLTNPLPLC